jgi:hypothetical protein
MQHVIHPRFVVYPAAAKGFIKGADFANSLVTSADIKVVDSYLDKVRVFDVS